jgi:hypothetical protein
MPSGPSLHINNYFLLFPKRAFSPDSNLRLNVKPHGIAYEAIPIAQEALCIRVSRQFVASYVKNVYAKLGHTSTITLPDLPDVRFISVVQNPLVIKPKNLPHRAVQGGESMSSFSYRESKRLPANVSNGASNKYSDRSKDARNHSCIPNSPRFVSGAPQTLHPSHQARSHKADSV